jgi:hypothetical protein
MSEHLSQTQLTGYSGRTLPPEELLAVDNHLASCDVCHERLTLILPAKRVISPFESEPFHLDYEEHLEPYVDGKANDIDREIVDSHVALCSKCATDLKDLVAFKQQPTAGARVGSSWWKQWLPQWASLPAPALAAAVVIVVFILAMAVLFWTTKPASQPGQQVQTDLPVSDKPSPAPTEHTTQTDPSSNQREEPLIALNDAGGQVIVNQRGQLEGLHDLPPDLKESVERALNTRRLRASPALTGWPTGAGNLRGDLDQQSTFAPLEPTDVVVETDRPTFRWRALEGAAHYIVTIYDTRLRQVGSSEPVTGTEWTIPNALARGVTYSWQISATKDGEKVVSPKPPLPEARFRILDQRAVVALARLKEFAGTSHLALGVFYWKHGLIEKSEREFQALAKANPNSTVVAELLASIRSLRRG